MKLLLTFTFGISLKTWHDLGILDREILIYKAMLDDGHKVGFLTYGDDRDLELKSIVGDIEIYPVYSYIKRHRSKMLRFLTSFYIPFKLAHVFKEYDLYKTNQMLGAWVAVVAKFLYKKTLVVRCGYEWLRNAFREAQGLKKIWVAVLGYFLELTAYSAGDKIIVSAENIYNFVYRCYRKSAPKVICIPNFIDIDNFRKFDVSEPYNNRILYVGRLDLRKNLLAVIRVIKDSKHKFGLDIIGSGKHLAKLKKFVDKHTPDVRFLGMIPNGRLPSHINRYPVFILASYFENNPKSLLEAMACERLVVGSDVEGIREMIENDVSGILVPTKFAGVKSGLEKAFVLDNEKRRAMGKRAREFVLKNSSFQEAYKREKAVYKELNI